MHAELTTTHDTAVIRLSGRFDFSSHREFKQCYEDAFSEPAVRKVVVDMKNVEYLDSAALGMLLLLKQAADQLTLPVALQNCWGLVKEILDVANFGVLFEMQ
jgi:anti-anti-sigma factor